MLRLIGIVFLNLWHGVSRKNGAPALMVLLVASIAVLGLSHNSVAETTNHYNDHRSSGSSSVTDDNDRVATNPSLGFVNPSLGMQPNSNQKIAQNSSQPKASVDKKTTQPTTKPTQPAKVSIASIQLSPETTTCSQGQTEYNWAYATVTLNNVPKNNKSTLSWYWETRVDSGSNTSGQPPIDGSVHTAQITGNSLKLTANSQNEPFTSNNNYAYSFRLHITGPSDAFSSWISIPETATNSSCQ